MPRDRGGEPPNHTGNRAYSAASNRGPPTMRASTLLVLIPAVAMFAPAASAQVATVLSLHDVVARMDAEGTNVPGKAPPLNRLARIMNAHFQAEAGDAPQPAQRRARRTVVQVNDGPAAMLFSGQREQMAVFEGIVKQLHRAERRELLVQCTVVRMTRALAKQHGLVINLPTPVDEVAAGKILKAALQAKGSLQNLAEVRARPLVPFRAEPQADARKAGATPAPAPLRLRGDVVLVADDEALFALQAVCTALPEDPTMLPASPLLDTTFRLRAGTGVMLLTKAGMPEAPATGDQAPAAAGDGEAVALWLRFVAVAERQPAGDPTRSDPGK